MGAREAVQAAVNDAAQSQGGTTKTAGSVKAQAPGSTSLACGKPGFFDESGAMGDAWQSPQFTNQEDEITEE